MVDGGGGEEGQGVTGAMNARQGNTPVYTGGVVGAMKGQARGHPPFYTGGKKGRKEGWKDWEGKAQGGLDPHVVTGVTAKERGERAGRWCEGVGQRGLAVGRDRDVRPGASTGSCGRK